MIRKTLTAAGAALALAAGLATPVHAASHDVSADVPIWWNTLSFGDGLDTFGTFGDTLATAGATFDEVFLFFSPPVGSQISFDGTADYTKTGKATVSFTGFDFGVLTSQNYDENGNYVGSTLTSLSMSDSGLTRFAFNGQSADDELNSGVYYIEVTGKTLLADGGFSGHINTTAIPEPGSLALMLAGLGVVGTLARRRKQQA